MPSSVSAGFAEFLRRLTPSDAETEAAKSHRASIEACLRANFDMLRFFRTGSFGHGTSVRYSSDVDYFAVLPTSRLTRNSNSTLSAVREALAARFPRTDVGVRAPAVRVPFGDKASEAHEVIPADDVGRTSGGQTMYDIPDRAGGWMRSSPDAHNAYVDRVDRKFEGKVKPLVRLIKAWAFMNNAPVRSFYLELRIAVYAESQSSIVYSLDVRYLINHLISIDLAALRDPVGVAGLIQPNASDSQKADTLSRLNTALGRADNALAAEKAGKIPDAFHWWDRLFGGIFPAYG